ncbi:MAG: hypothetical protein QOD75_2921 [Blastocatellia bacterium]|nr:hypothetical protein [Blastocatellia bacterium]
MVATVHGYLAAWLAIWMLFHPYKPLKLLGVTIWPQGMIPRHRARLAQSIGNAVGNELVSQDTIFNALFETGFFNRKIETFVNTYTNELLATVYPSFLEALPSAARAPVLDTISALQFRLAEHITSVLKSEQTAEAITAFVDHQVDALLARNLNETVSEETFAKILSFAEDRFHDLVTQHGFEAKVREFVSGRLDEFATSQATLAEMFTPETVGLIKERIHRAVPPIVHQLADIATSASTQQQIGALIKREVDDYYTQLSFLKKIFISRETIHHEVDELVHKTLPRRIDEYLRGAAFVQEAEAFLNSTIDNLLTRPLNELAGQISGEKFETIKNQITERVLALANSPELIKSLSAYFTDAMARLQPQTLSELLAQVNPDSAPRLKNFLTKSLLTVLARDDTARTINSILSSQIERLLIAPIGRLGDQLPEHTVDRASTALTARITEAARERLPAAIAEFDVGGLVRNKVSDYPLEKLESLVLSVAQHHLKTIELFGAVIGLFIGVGQAIYFWFTYVPRH